MLVLFGYLCDFLLHLAEFKLHGVDRLLELGAFTLGLVHAVAQFFDKGADVTSLHMANRVESKTKREGLTLFC